MPDSISHRGFFLWNTSLPRCIWFPHGIAPRMAWSGFIGHGCMEYPPSLSSSIPYNLFNESS